MVSSSRLLEAAVDAPSEQCHTFSLSASLTRGCTRPRVLLRGVRPTRLLALGQSEGTLHHETHEASPQCVVCEGGTSASASSYSCSPPTLLRVLRDFGPVATSPLGMGTLARTLPRFGRPSEAAVASALLFLSSTDSTNASVVDNSMLFHLFGLFSTGTGHAQMDPLVQSAVSIARSSTFEWRMDVFVQAVTDVAAQFSAPLDWRLIIRSFDIAGLEKRLNRSSFTEIAKAYTEGTGGALLPADCLLDEWINSDAQLCMIRHGLAVQEFVDWTTVEVFTGATTEDASNPYSRVALVAKLVELDARELLQQAVRESSNLVLLSLTCAKPKTNSSLQQKLTVTLLTPMIAGFPRDKKTLRQMWNVTPALVEAGIISMWRQDPLLIRLAYRIALEMNILSDLLASVTSVEFSFELALQAYSEKNVNLENWLNDVVSSKGQEVVVDIVHHLSKKARCLDSNSALTLSLDGVRITLRSILKLLATPRCFQSSEVMSDIQELHSVYVHLTPRMKNLAPSEDVGNPKILIGTSTLDDPSANFSRRQEISAPLSDANESISTAAVNAASLLLPSPVTSSRSPVSFPNAIEKEATVFFENLYTRGMSIDRAVEVLKGLKYSKSEYEERVFRCAMHSLFDEYRFLKEYPDRELEITGTLFGTVIRENLLSRELQGLAIRCVLDALRMVETPHSPHARLATFGLCALERFTERLRDWPYYCSEVLKIQKLRDVNPVLENEIKRIYAQYRGPVPSRLEREFAVEMYPNNIHIGSDGGESEVAAPLLLSDSLPDSNAVHELVSSPKSVSNTPVKDPVLSRGLRTSPAVGLENALIVSRMNLTALLGMTSEEADKVIAPNEALQDKIKFIFNNLSSVTMDDKVSEMLEILESQYHRFFAIYIVVKRASSEANFHHLYLTLLEKMDSKAPTLFPMVFDTSYRRVKVLLRSEKITCSTAERMVLKSLGSWIGSLTLARNKPILRKELDLKMLLMDAYSEGRLIAVVPFVSKVLESSHRSLIFKTTNPWIRGILCLLKEIYCVPDLKLNMKFELQLLCKGLNIDVNEVAASDLLSRCRAPDKTNNPDFNTKKTANASPLRSSVSPATSHSPDTKRVYDQSGTSSRAGVPMFSLGDPQAVTSVLTHVQAAAQATQADLSGSILPETLSISAEALDDLSNALGGSSITSTMPSASHLSRSTIGSLSATAVPGGNQHQNNIVPGGGTVIPNLSQYITISPTLLLFQTNPSLKRLLPLAIDRAIREIIQPVVERSCAIAFLTTKELTLKDFAREKDMEVVRRAAIQMVQQLAGSLALVTSKEPLRVSMGNQLRSLLSPIAGDQGLVEQTAQVICAGNLEIGCAIIERHAKEKAARDLNEKIGSAFNSRRQHYSPYCPEQEPGPDVIQVYEEFSRLQCILAGHASHSGLRLASALDSQTVRRSSNSDPPMRDKSTVAPLHFRAMNNTHQVGQEYRVKSNVLKAPISDKQAPNQVDAENASSIMQSEVPDQSSKDGRTVAAMPIARTDSSPTHAVFGIALPNMANSAAVQSAILAVSGGCNDAGSSVPGVSIGCSALAPEEEALTTQRVLERFNAIYPRILALVNEIVTSSLKVAGLGDIPGDHELHGLWAQIPAAVKKSVTADEAGMAVAQKVFKGLYEGHSTLHREIHVAILEGLRESCRRLSKELVSWLAYSEEKKKLNKDCIVALLKPGSLLNITNYDELLTKTMDGGRNLAAVEFACFLIKRAVIDEPLATAAELSITLEAMSKLGRRVNPPKLNFAPNGLSSLVEEARSAAHDSVTGNQVSASNEFPAGALARPVRETELPDPIGTKEVVANCLIEWQRLLASDSTRRPLPEYAVAKFINNIRATLWNDRLSRDRFFRTTVELLSTVTASALQSPRVGTPGEFSAAPYTVVDSTVRLLGAACRYDRDGSADFSQQGILMLSQFFGCLAMDILKSAAGTDLRPHFRLFSGVIQELAPRVNANSPDTPQSTGNVVSEETEWVLPKHRTRADAINFLEDNGRGYMSIVANAYIRSAQEGTCDLQNVQVQAAVVGALSACSPIVVPGFAFSWLQLVSNKDVLSQLLLSPKGHGRGRYMFLHLLLLHLSFLSTYLKSPKEYFTDGVRVLYKGTLRILLVLLHDFPEFLCDFHMAIVDVIPHNCVQLRNIVLASFPKSMRLPDPFLPELKVDQLPEMAMQPRILRGYEKCIESSGLKSVIDTYLRRQANRGLRPPLLQEYLSEGNGSGVAKYSVPMFGSLVLYVGQHVITNSEPGIAASMEAPATYLFEGLVRELDPEGQYHLFNAIANQLRYPNCHTLYYSRLVLCLFHNSNDDYVKEKITRVLLERLIANRPHPWGLLVTFVELVKNSVYNFWGHDFVRCAPEIEELFENVAKVCIGPAMDNFKNSVSMST